jgi:hypothetical protein
VVDACAKPAIERMAGLAGLWKLGRDVVWHAPAHRLRTVPVGLMARNASGRKPLKLAHGCALMTVLTLHGRMRAQQREAVLVILHLLHGNIPTLHRVALRAVSAHFSLVNVRVAVLAILPHIREDGLHMALRAFHFFVHAAQRIFCFVVIELRNGLDWPPCCGGMTVFARDGQRTVGAVRALPLRRRSGSVGWLPREY